VANLTRTSSFYSDRGSAGQQPDLPAAETFGWLCSSWTFW
jgi:hypothetical protein